MGPDVEALALAFYSGVPWERLTEAEREAFIHYEKGMESIKHVHGHGGHTRIVWIDEA